MKRLQIRRSIKIHKHMFHKSNAYLAAFQIAKANCHVVLSAIKYVVLVPNRPRGVNSVLVAWAAGKDIFQIGT